MSGITSIEMPMSEIVKYKPLLDKLDKEKSNKRFGVCLVEDGDMKTLTRNPLFNKRAAIIRKQHVK